MKTLAGRFNRGKPHSKGVPPRLVGHTGGGMRCERCGGGTCVVDSRPTGTGVAITKPSDNSVRRVRCCLDCGFRFTTYEFSSRNPEGHRHALERAAEILRKSAAEVEALLRDRFEDV